MIGEWVNAITFAVIGATLIHIYNPTIYNSNLIYGKVDVNW